MSACVRWNHTRLGCCIAMEALVDTGAGGEGYSSAAFVCYVECSRPGGQSMMSSRDKGIHSCGRPIARATRPPRENIGIV